MQTQEIIGSRKCFHRQTSVLPAFTVLQLHSQFVSQLHRFSSHLTAVTSVRNFIRARVHQMKSVVMSEIPQPRNQRTTGGQCLICMKTGAVVVVFSLASIILYACLRRFFDTTEPHGILECYRRIGSFQKWSYGEQISFIRRMAPDKFQDPLVPLNETARDLEHLSI